MNRSEKDVASCRRSFIKNCAAAAAGILLLGQTDLVLAKSSKVPGKTNKKKAVPERKLSFYNLHTGESLKAVYWADGRYVKESLRDINRILRDFRNNEVRQIEPALLDLLYDVRHKVGSKEPYNIISGYRSPATNEMLAEQSDGVARHSLHMDGMAIDIRLPDRALGKVRKAALALERGGVGFYPKSNFVHLDVGRPRWWVG